MLRAELCQGLAEHLPYPSGYFDCVYHVGGINFFSDQRAAPAEMVRVARSGTRLLVVDETEELASHYENRWPMKAFFKNRPRKIEPPVDLLPPGMQEIAVERMWDDQLYMLVFRNAPQIVQRLVEENRYRFHNTCMASGGSHSQAQIALSAHFSGEQQAMLDAGTPACESRAAPRPGQTGILFWPTFPSFESAHSLHGESAHTCHGFQADFSRENLSRVHGNRINRGLGCMESDKQLWFCRSPEVGISGDLHLCPCSHPAE